MPIYMSASPDIAPAPDYTFLTEVRAGGNGDPDATPEYDAGDPYDLATGRTTWDSSLTNGMDSGNVQVQLHVWHADGVAHVTWSLGGDTSGDLTYDGADYDALSGVELVAGVQSSEMEFTWSNVAVTFRKADTTTETIAVEDPVDATTIGTSNSAREAFCTVTPTNGDNDEMILTAMVRLRSTTANLQPEPNDLFGQAFVFAIAAA